MDVYTGVLKEKHPVFTKTRGKQKILKNIFGYNL